LPDENVAADESAAVPSEPRKRVESPAKVILPIDPAFVSVQPDPAARPWTAKTDEELVRMIQVSGALGFKNSLGLQHDLSATAPPLEFTIGVRGADFLSEVDRAGFVEFQTLKSDNGASQIPRKFPPRMATATTNWVVPQRDKGRPESAGAFSLPIELERPRESFKMLTRVEGALRLSLVEQSQVISISNVATNVGSVTAEPLQKRGMNIVVTRPDEITLVAEVSGDTSQFMDTRLTGIDPGTTIFGVNRLELNGQLIYQYNFVGSIPQEVAMEFRVIDKARKIVVPFSFNDVKLLNAGR